jgi:hypothetical protein
MTRQTVHIEENVAERITEGLDFKPSRSVRNQNFVVLSILAPTGTNQTTPTSFGIKIFGCFNTIDEANAYAKELQGECDVFDYWVMSLCEWVKLPPAIERLDDIRFRETEMEQLRQSEIEMREARAKIMQERVRTKEAPLQISGAS